MSIVSFPLRPTTRRAGSFLPDDGVALRALRKATSMLGMAFGKRLAEMRDSEMPQLSTHAKLEELSLQQTLLWETIDILAGRWDKIPIRHRPHYTPENRFRILRNKDLLALSGEETARIFGLSGGTVHRWEAECRLHPEVSSVGSLFKPTPPVRRYADVAHHLVTLMALCGLGGNEGIAQRLARAGWKISARTVGRIRTGNVRPTSERSPSEPEKDRGRRLAARGPHEKVLIDLTTVKALFGILCFKVAVVLDIFSRFPLSYRVFSKEPSAVEMTELLAEACAEKVPRVLITDKGPQFTAEDFRAAVSCLGIEHRFGAVGRFGSICLLERFWCSLKDTLLLRLIKPLMRCDLERRVRFGLLHYALYRPHQGLRGATPAEVYQQLPPAHLHAVPPPRGQPGEFVDFPAYRVRYLDREHRLPILVREAA